jgi:hypothetical protein
MFEVKPDRDTFDAVRRAVIVTLRSEYGRVLSDGVREHVRVDTVALDPAYWRVEGKLDGGRDFGFDVTVAAKTEANDEVLSYLRGRVDARYGDFVDADVVTFDKVSLRPNAWFVDAKIPASGDPE